MDYIGQIEGESESVGMTSKATALEALKQIGIAMEVPALYPELSGIQNLRMAATARKVPKERVEELVRFHRSGGQTFGSHRNLFHGNENAAESGNSDCGSTQTGNSGRAHQWP